MNDKKRKKSTDESDEIRFGINRSAESADVLKYQETRDPELLEKIYMRRIPTLRFMSVKNAHVCDDVESELKCVFMRAIEKFRKNGRQFNTYLYTSMKNHMTNLVKGKKRKKRTVENEMMNPESTFLRMDDSIGGEADSEGETYHDVIGDDTDDWSNNIDVRAVTELVAKRSWILADIFLDMVKGACSSSRRREYSDRVKMTPGKTPEELIRSAVGIPRQLYKIVGHSVSGDYVHYCVEVSSRKCIDHIRSDVVSGVSL